MLSACVLWNSGDCKATMLSSFQGLMYLHEPVRQKQRYSKDTPVSLNLIKPLQPMYPKKGEFAQKSRDEKKKSLEA